MEKKRGLGGDVRSARDRWDDAAVVNANGTHEPAPDDALLVPWGTGCELSIGEETCHLRARASTAGGTVVRLPWAEHEVLAVAIRARGGTKELDVIDQSTILTGDPGTLQALPESPGVSGELLEIRQRESETRKNQLPPHAMSPVARRRVP